MVKRNLRRILPQSPTSSAINWTATAVFLFSLVLIKAYNVSGVEAAVFAMLALAVPLIVLEFIVLEPYRRPSTGLDFTLKRKINLSRVVVKITGLYVTMGCVALIYWLFPLYRSPIFDNYWQFAWPTVVIILAGGIPYFAWLDKFQVKPRDAYWHAGMMVLGRTKVWDGRVIWQHALGWGIKVFFLPLMFCFLIGNITFMKGADPAAALQSFPYFYDYVFNLIFTVDLVFITVGYLMTLQVLDSHIRTAEPTFLGWSVALLCYQPFWDFISGNYLQYDDSFFWTNLFPSTSVLYPVWGLTILCLLFLYMWASVTFGLRFSNLTNRGILTNGPYRYSMHPAYVAKNLSWWLISIPFISQAGPWEAIRQSVLLLLVNGIYYLRARTEERHLSLDPEYVTYGLAMNTRSVFRGLYTVLPFLRYDPQNYLAQQRNMRMMVPEITQTLE